MDNLSDYIQWMGDYPFSATGFREADALILCVISYFDLAPVFEKRSGVHRVKDCADMLAEGRARLLITGKDLGYRQILERAAASRRFGQLRMTNYVDRLRSQPPLQFSAVCFHDEADLSFLAYRGTDNSLAGWKEDFMISFCRTEAQEMALQYARAQLKPGRRWLLGGHSKGGNLALYTACLLEEELWQRVERVYLLDGPGLCPEVMDLGCMERIDARTTRVIPGFSVVGKLFEPQITDTRIVRSSAKGLMQHSLATWGIDHGGLALLERGEPAGQLINAALNDWIADISQEDRVIFTDELFAALAAGGAKNLDQLEDEGPGGLEAVLRRLEKSSTVTKKTLGDLPRQMVKQGIPVSVRKRLEKITEKE